MATKFAFLVHPRNELREDMGLLFGKPCGLVPDPVWRAVLKLPLPPVVTGQMSYVDRPEEVVGSIITVPLTPRQLLDMPRNKVQARVSEAVDLAGKVGAKIVGLGALTASVTAGGKSLAKRTDIGVTNGNAFTAAMTVLGVQKLVETMKSEPLIGLVGATGSVGSCLTELLTRRYPGRYLLVGRNQGRLQKLAASVAGKAEISTSTDMADIRKCDLVVLLTSAAEAILKSEHLKPGAIVLDDTVPRNTDQGLLQSRPDVLIVDGGLVQIPAARLRGSIGLAPGLAYACLAETMLLALAGHTEHFTIGTPRLEQAQYMLDLATKHQHLGFHLAPIRSFGRLIPELDLGPAPSGREGTVSWAA